MNYWLIRGIDSANHSVWFKLISGKYIDTEGKAALFFERWVKENDTRALRDLWFVTKISEDAFSLYSGRIVSLADEDVLRGLL
jgi:hypothetical protein